MREWKWSVVFFAMQWFDLYWWMSYSKTIDVRSIASYHWMLDEEYLVESKLYALSFMKLCSTGVTQVTLILPFWSPPPPPTPPHPSLFRMHRLLASSTWWENSIRRSSRAGTHFFSSQEIKGGEKEQNMKEPATLSLESLCCFLLSFLSHLMEKRETVG